MRKTMWTGLLLMVLLALPVTAQTAATGSGQALSRKGRPIACAGGFLRASRAAVAGCADGRGGGASRLRIRRLVRGLRARENTAFGNFELRVVGDGVEIVVAVDQA